MKKYLLWLIALLYFLSPIDIIPDYVIGPGFLDDLFVLTVLVWWWISRIKSTSSTNKKTFNSSRERRKTPDEDKEEDPYKILGITQDASREEIKAAFKRLAAQYHPDKVQHLGKEFQILAHTKFVKIKNAYEKLIDK